MDDGGSCEVCTHVAVSDCERIRPGLIAQPVNTWSSLAYCVAGGWILANREPTPQRTVLGVGAIAAGLGSVAYHGPGGRPGKVLHDVSAAALAIGTFGALARAPGRTHNWYLSVGCFAVAVGVHTASRTDRVLCRPDSVLQGHAAWHVLGSLAAVLASDQERSRRIRSFGSR